MNDAQGRLNDQAGPLKGRFWHYNARLLVRLTPPHIPSQMVRGERHF
jgi:hypothetical protein